MDQPLADLEARADHVAHRLGLLANPRRLLILCQLAAGEASVSALNQTLNIGQSALSQHLAKLRDAGIVATRREAQTIYYRIDDAETETLMAALYDTFCGSN
ncbi:ArsR/SmtB family transcription factor [Aliiroseovarius sp. YM-037]|uniref:ArsR/SmtB family transcription factor n=1 Tax=Aliiroseovarius sp. YM-037 TaxID=3341728 RepID=UPI003A7FF38B